MHVNLFATEYTGHGSLHATNLLRFRWIVLQLGMHRFYLLLHSLDGFEIFDGLDF